MPMAVRELSPGCTNDGTFPPYPEGAALQAPITGRTRRGALWQVLFLRDCVINICEWVIYAATGVYRESSSEFETPAPQHEGA